ncbi:MAG: valine--tRNA ligase, partial [Bacteroidia bacterium]|nr:valine--tRNA ligase [Bacteroidia bacterium]
LLSFESIIQKLCNVSEIHEEENRPVNTYSFVIKGTEYALALPSTIDAEVEKKRLQKELEYSKGFLKSVQSKLANERFVTNAKPEIIQLEKQKQTDTEAKIKALEEQLANF